MIRIVVAALVVVAGLAGPAGAEAPSTNAKSAAKAHYAKGRAHQEAGAYDEALGEYNAAFQLVPLPQLLFNIGQVLRLKGDKAAAIDAYRKYLVSTPDGAASDEAREHVAALDLELKLAAAEAAQRKATADAEAARREAAEAEAARKQAEAAVASQQHSAKDDEERLHRLALEMEERTRAKQAEEAVALQKRLEEAHRAGRRLRVIGGVAIALGFVFAAGLVWIPVVDGSNASHQIDNLNSGSGTPMWSTAADGLLKNQQRDSSEIVAFVATGLGLIIAGAIVSDQGARARRNAEERARTPSLTLAPQLSPSTAGLLLRGEF